MPVPFKLTHHPKADLAGVERAANCREEAKDADRELTTGRLVYVESEMRPFYAMKRCRIHPRRKGRTTVDAFRSAHKDRQTFEESMICFYYSSMRIFLYKNIRTEAY
jgi:hypothetical protein